MKVLVTGAAQGLGRAVVDHALARGATVMAIDRDAAGLAKLEWEHPRHVTTRTIDLADPEAVARLTAEIARHFTFDLAVLNAGISATGAFEAIPAEAYARLVRVNVTAPLVMAAGLVRPYADGRSAMRRGSTVTFVSSLSHVTGYPGAAVYAATKDAVAAYAESVRRPFRKRGVRVNTVFPGPIRTEHAARHAPAGARPEKRMAPARVAKAIWKGRRERHIFPGLAASTVSAAGRFAPRTMTRLMRRVIFERLDGQVW